jgi:hypothetical protein
LKGNILFSRVWRAFVTAVTMQLEVGNLFKSIFPDTWVPEVRRATIWVIEEILDIRLVVYQARRPRALYHW